MLDWFWKFNSHYLQDKYFSNSLQIFPSAQCENSQKWCTSRIGAVSYIHVNDDHLHNAALPSDSLGSQAATVVRTPASHVQTTFITYGYSVRTAGVNASNVMSLFRRCIKRKWPNVWDVNVGGPATSTTPTDATVTCDRWGKAVSVFTFRSRGFRACPDSASTCGFQKPCSSVSLQLSSWTRGQTQRALRRVHVAIPHLAKPNQHLRTWIGCNNASEDTTQVHSGDWRAIKNVPYWKDQCEHMWSLATGTDDTVVMRYDTYDRCDCSLNAAQLSE